MACLVDHRFRKHGVLANPVYLYTEYGVLSGEQSAHKNRQKAQKQVDHPVCFFYWYTYKKSPFSFLRVTLTFESWVRVEAFLNFS